MNLINFTDITSNTVGTIVATLIIAISSFFWKPFRNWLFTKDPKIREELFKIWRLISYPYLRLIIFILSIIILYFDYQYKAFVSLLSIFIFLTFFKVKKTFPLLSQTSSIFSENFETRKIDPKKWEIKTGKPSFVNDMGWPRLNLTKIQPREATNTFMLVKNLELESGTITCEVFLGQDAIFNIVFFCDSQKDNWHMARFDSRETEHDCFLVKDEGKGQNWRINVSSPLRTESMWWQTIKVVFNSESARMYRNGELLAEVKNPPIFGKKIGFFNEINDVMINNFVVSEVE